MKKAYLVVGCPGSGKSWVCDQLKQMFRYVPHDMFINKDYLDAIQRSKDTDKPLLIETPFSISQIKEPLEKRGFQVEPVFIQEKPETIAERYKARENRDIPKGHLTRQQTYASRAKEANAFSGTSSEVLEHLKKLGQE